MDRQSRFQYVLYRIAVAMGGLLLAMGSELSIGFVSVQAAETDSTYDQEMLLNPDPSLLKAEARGRVIIYDGLDSQQVEKALDTQFDRIDNMMFIRTRYEQKDDMVEEYDDCD
ncbi:MAG: hypothetical protein WAL92_06665 [Thiogranum sp.]